MSVLMRC